MAADVGTTAPDFTLPNQDREAVTLSAELAKGKPVVLAFFPAAFSSVCQKELCTFRDAARLGSLNNLSKAQVFGISVDTFFALKAFGAEQKLSFPLLSDFNKDVIRAYDVLNPDMVGLKGIAKRSVVVVSGDGRIAYREVLDDARNEPDYAKLNAALASL
ncbi:MAG: redoxin domain-containing protein [Acidimicrobiia bacterium]|nr:redoxin domain-containing protein [Acidimicrobiia bacterium]